MSRVFVHGIGAVSPAGWGVPALRAVLEKGGPLPTQALARPGWSKPFQVRTVPGPAQRLAFLAHPRLRRASAITQYAIGASCEALGEDAGRVQNGELRLGIVVCLMPGCVTYSRRFYEEVLGDPAMASPLIFAETVYNAPASHLAAFLNSGTVSYTLVGDDGSFLQGLALAAGWLLNDEADGCLVVGANEMDWIVADAVQLFERQSVPGAGAGALYLRKESSTESALELARITDAFLFSTAGARSAAAQRMRAQLPECRPRELLCPGTQEVARADADELAAWTDWTGARLAPKQLLGEAFTASAAWQCIAACDALERGAFNAANVSIVGANEQAIGARFVNPEIL
jgi:3-oxoacyl-(acyl-carrier-protein) synthase